MYLSIPLAFPLLLASSALAQYGSSSGGSSGSSGGSAVASSPASAGSAAPSGMVKMHVVKVSNKNGDLTFEPNNMQAAPGEMVQFHFYPKNHSVVASTFDNPCVPISNIMPQTMGFFSGFMPVKPTDAMMPSYTLVINDTKPIWYYCSQGDHCQDGMVGVINPPAANKSRTIESFTNLAKSAPENLSPGETSSSATSDDGDGDVDMPPSSGSTSAAAPPPAAPSSAGTPAAPPLAGTNSSTGSATPSGTAGGTAVQTFVPGAGNVFAARLDIVSSVALAGFIGFVVTLF